MQHWSLEQRISGQTIGLVPTMGYLHNGHLSLLNLARSECDIVVVSIFVNPTQFGFGEDFGKYPRDEEGDSSMCNEYGVDALFIPDADEMYASDASVYVEENSLSNGLCGVLRPGHFTGVCTVVAKLFNIVLPHKSIFGQKDYQQAVVIQRMIRDLNFPVELKVAPIVREQDGVALSSRNVYLSEDERERAHTISVSLEMVHEKFFAGEVDAKVLKELIVENLQEASLDIDYVEIVDGALLTPVESVDMGDVVLIAAYCGKTRLIDNCIF